MTDILSGKRILLGVTGSIAAYKTVDWLRELRRAGAEVTVVMTGSATRFVAPLTFAALSGNPVHTDMFARRAAETIPHISLARDHDLILIAPATARTVARLAHGLAEDLLATVALAARVPLLVCPAMNCRMYTHPATQANLERLRGYGYTVLDPGAGAMACGDEGPGRLPEWDLVQEAIRAAFSPQDLAGHTVLVTAGPTREHLDPVRFLSNRSTGKMGYALARTARYRGAGVILVSGPTGLPPPPGIEMIRVDTALEMRDAVLAAVDRAAVVVKSAAVSDFRPAHMAAHKIKKDDAGNTLELVRNPDILAELGERRGDKKMPLLVGFAAESRDLLAEGRRKLKAKKLDLIVVNDITDPDAGFGTETNRVLLIDRTGGEEESPLLSKGEIASRIWDRVVDLLS
ncbi:MAG: bifunctional phosphopantothenoylcysteine decarboxylase/phosphopantothenate--cysteine ligase CoaBC [Desulfobacterales bacterium]|nr:bifunctional phosphopantothenoylcysteine decarboxylase/phosphopantothenate--cysteine ligase CoaBC [Desulfobacterales bacterium]